ncbi:MAG TPA: hypothetical protein VGP36_18215 [Mycobacteriales bacterium]|jgi:hypothetical protein|nr:hypothetical protein [Mycobacteriales bacterium]
MTRDNCFRGLMITAGVPSTLMIVTHHPWLGAATLAGAVTAWMACEVMAVRARQARDAALLDYARTATNLGDDPAPVISALRSRSPDPEEDDLFRPEPDERPWVHLRPSEW